MRKPQHAWIADIDNSYDAFVPLLTAKPHCIEDLPTEIIEAQAKQQESKTSRNFAYGDHKQQKGQASFPNPYTPEIEAFDQSIGEDGKLASLVPDVATEFKPLENTTLTFVDTEEKLAKACEVLSSVTELAVDLEHHSSRTYLGITSLMQVSTREEDFIIDTITLRKHLGDALRPIFDNPDIVKVLHGADMDIEWLQRDLGLYVVNMFDTGQASRVLGLKGFGLAFLLQTYCSVLTDKKYQLADWRQRPLPEEMVKYAREDTHYLLYVYDRLRIELLERGRASNAANPYAPLKAVYHKSSALCLKSYEKPEVKDYNFYMLVARNKALQSLNQVRVLKMLLKWRDFVARKEDESNHYMLPNHVLFQIGRDLPTTRNELRDSCRAHVPPAVLLH